MHKTKILHPFPNYSISVLSRFSQLEGNLRLFEIDRA